jgi:co-chaperonin GroES (HSP10)
VIKPLNNHCLVELINDHEGLIGVSDENVQKGVLISAELTQDHLTVSTGYRITQIENIAIALDEKAGKVVYWQEYADAGSKFMIDGKQYALVPFYRLIGVDDEQTTA